MVCSEVDSFFSISTRGGLDINFITQNHIYYASLMMTAEL